MLDNNSSVADCRFFSYLGLFFVIAGWLGFALALLGFFYWPAIIIGLILILGAFFYFVPKDKVKLRISKEFCIVSVLMAFLVILFSFFVTPTIFSGRDQGSISEAAIRLSQNHRLEFSTPVSQEFFKIYGVGKALNFPGFYYTASGNLATQFPLPYIGWLSLFYGLFSLSGLIAANAILFFIFLVSFFLLAKIYLSRRWAILGLLFALASFPFIWFFKFTLSEMMALSLLWFFILNIILYIRTKSDLYYFITLATGTLLFFTRIEGLFFFFIGLIVIYFATRKDSVIWKKRRFIGLYLPGILFTAAFFLNLRQDLPFYREMAKVILKSPGELASGVENGDFFNQWKIFALYGLLPFIVTGLIGIIQTLRERKWDWLLPLFITLPTFFYLLHSWISSDQPWLLRRFVFSLLPVFIFYTLIFLNSLPPGKNRWHLPAMVISILIIAFNLPAFTKFAFYSENRGLLPEIQNISYNFKDTDLILVDREATGDGFSMMAGPLNFLYEKNSVYFFNPDDWQKINASRFNKIYLIVSDPQINFYQNSPFGNRLTFYKDYRLETSRLNQSDENSSARLPAIENIQIRGKIFEIKK